MENYTTNNQHTYNTDSITGTTYGTIIGGTNCTVGGDYSSFIVSGKPNEKNGVLATNMSEDSFFINESKKLDGELILKYSPVDFRWKIYNNGNYKKVDNIKLNNSDAKTDLYTYNGKTIGVLIVKVDKYEMINEYIIN